MSPHSQFAQGRERRSGGARWLSERNSLWRTCSLEDLLADLMLKLGMCRDRVSMSETRSLYAGVRPRPKKTAMPSHRRLVSSPVPHRAEVCRPNLFVPLTGSFAGPGRVHSTPFLARS